MDFTVIIVALMISFGIPLRNKAVKEYRKKKEQQTSKEKKSVPTGSIHGLIGENDGVPYTGRAVTPNFRRDNIGWCGNRSGDYRAAQKYWVYD